MGDATKAAVEWIREQLQNDTRAVARSLLAHLDGEPERLAAAREEQREALGLSRWPVLVPFIAAMVRKLDANKPKKGGREGWQNDDPQALLARVREEVDELAHAVAVSPRVDILHEAADVANMAMMVADSEGAIRDTPLDATPLTATPLADRLRDAEESAHRGWEQADSLHLSVKEWRERAERAEAERDEAVAALRALLPEVYGTHSPPTVGFAIDRHRIIAQARAVLAKYPEGER